MDNADNRNDAHPARPLSLLKRLSHEFEDSHPPEGFVAATSDLASTFVAEHIKPKIDGKPLAAQGNGQEEERVDPVEHLAGEPAALEKGRPTDATSNKREPSSD